MKAIVTGAVLAGSLDATVQYAVYEKIDPMSVISSSAVGAVSSGGGLMFTGAAILGKISYFKAIFYTALTSRAANAGVRRMPKWSTHLIHQPPKRIPTGRQNVANDLWLPGGKLPTGNDEAVIDAI
jgi:hypothetical protein